MCDTPTTVSPAIRGMVSAREESLPVRFAPDYGCLAAPAMGITL
jgi:hypothetical protein